MAKSLEIYPADFDPKSAYETMSGDYERKSFLSIHQLTEEDIYEYIAQASAAERILDRPDVYGVNLLDMCVGSFVMRQASTRTGGSMKTALDKLGGRGTLVSGMGASSEAKGETLGDSWLAFAGQSDFIGTRTAEEYGPHFASWIISAYAQEGKLSRAIPVINLGDGRNEHPTQTLGDLFTISKFAGKDFKDITLTIVGDHERYRAFHSLLIGANTLGMKVLAVQSSVAQIPEEYVSLLGENLTIVDDLDDALKQTDVLYIGRNPDEYSATDLESKKKAKREHRRSRILSRDYESWHIDLKRIQQMPDDAIVLHPRPRRNELNPDTDFDPRMRDVNQMEDMIKARMAVIALAMGRSLVETEAYLTATSRS